MVVLDEICCAVPRPVDADTVAAVHRLTGKIVFTGQQAAPALVALADTVSDIAACAGMDAGWRAARGEC